MKQTFLFAWIALGVVKMCSLLFANNSDRVVKLRYYLVGPISSTQFMQKSKCEACLGHQVSVYINQDTASMYTCVSEHHFHFIGKEKKTIQTCTYMQGQNKINRHHLMHNHPMTSVANT